VCFMKEELTDINFWVNEASVMEINSCYVVGSISFRPDQL